MPEPWIEMRQRDSEETDWVPKRKEQYFRRQGFLPVYVDDKVNERMGPPPPPTIRNVTGFREPNEAEKRVPPAVKEEPADAAVLAPEGAQEPAAADPAAVGEPTSKRSRSAAVSDQKRENA